MNDQKRREEYVQEFRRQIGAWNADIARWEGKARQAKAEIKERLAHELQVLNAQRELARYNLRLLEGASASAWAELRQGADDAWYRMQLAAEAGATYFDGLPATKRPRRTGRGH